MRAEGRMKPDDACPLPLQPRRPMASGVPTTPGSTPTEERLEAPDRVHELPQPPPVPPTPKAVVRPEPPVPCTRPPPRRHPLLVPPPPPSPPAAPSFPALWSCERCEKPIRWDDQGWRWVDGGRRCHAQCSVCSQCLVDQEGFCDIAGRLHCKRCATYDRCDLCGTGVTAAQRFSFGLDGKKRHALCCACGGCITKGRGVAGSDGKVYHEDCASPPPPEPPLEPPPQPHAWPQSQRQAPSSLAVATVGVLLHVEEPFLKAIKEKAAVRVTGVWNGSVERPAFVTWADGHTSTFLSWNARPSSAGLRVSSS